MVTATVPRFHVSTVLPSTTLTVHVPQEFATYVWPAAIVS